MSGLTTRGRCLLAAGLAAALCSVVLNERDLLRVSAFAVALPLLSLALALATRIGLAAERELRPSRLTVGDRTEVVLDIHAAGRMPSVGLMVEDGVPYTFGGRPQFIVRGLGWRTGIQFSYYLSPPVRGVHQVGPLHGWVTDPFGLAEFERDLGGRSEMVVIPKIEALTDWPGGSTPDAHHEGTLRRGSGHGLDDAVIRQYRQGDDLRRVHWRSSARRDELMVRVEERPRRGGTTVLLDHRAIAHRGDGAASSLEWAVSFAASVYLHLHQSGREVRLITEDRQVIADERTSGDTVLDRLAALEPTNDRDADWPVDPGSGHEFIGVFGALSPAAAAELVRVRTRRSGSVAVLLDVGAWASVADDGPAQPHDVARVLLDAGWDVVVARPTDTCSDVWLRLCRCETPGRYETTAGETR